MQQQAQHIEQHINNKYNNTLKEDFIKNTIKELTAKKGFLAVLTSFFIELFKGNMKNGTCSGVSFRLLSQLRGGNALPFRGFLKRVTKKRVFQIIKKS